MGRFGVIIFCIRILLNTKIEGKLIKSFHLCLAVSASGLHFGNSVGAEVVEIAILKLILIHSVKHERVININAGDLTVLYAHNHVALALKETAYGICTHLGCGETVTK